ncbi:MAG: FeoB-associated Cys-rich membrane protein [Oscillospiraceae bacterium]|nr:FeoB-associated Cys-rich membrane protein [Oscillospiraceae bacterium]MBQ9958854.1 FeoB-associated Cys-rich membrane protein [Oscillospiraceae bacterium]
MKLTDIIIILVLLALVGGIALYLRRQKKKGVQCVGCPYAQSCAARRAGQACSSAAQAVQRNAK